MCEVDGEIAEGPITINMSKKVAIADLARMANVNASTVSRALNDSPLVRPETKARIVRLAEELGYVMNVSARNLRRQSSEVIGMVIPMRPDSGQTISDPFYLEMVGAVSHAASKRGFDLIISVPEGGVENAQRRLLQTGRADGLIMIGQAGRIDKLEAPGALSNKTVVWGGEVKGGRQTVVGSDNKLGGKLAADHLLGLGRRSILFIGNRKLPEVKLRYEGFCAAYEDIGLHHSPELTLDEDFGGQSTFSDVRNFIANGLKIDGVFAASDVLAMSAIQALQAAGRNVPNDVSVVGYDNIGLASLLTPQLTTIDQNIRLGGELLVDVLLQKLEGKLVRTQHTPTELVIRESSIPS